MIEQLRIGNWVKAPLGEYMKVVQLGHNDYDKYILAVSKSGFGQNDFTGIELTPEILEKAGFSFDGYDWAKNGVVLSWSQRVIATNEYLGICVSDADHINKVHLLQNYYYFKTGTELNIEL